MEYKNSVVCITFDVGNNFCTDVIVSSSLQTFAPKVLLDIPSITAAEDCFATGTFCTSRIELSLSNKWMLYSQKLSATQFEQTTGKSKVYVRSIYQTSWQGSWSKSRRLLKLIWPPGLCLCHCSSPQGILRSSYEMDIMNFKLACCLEGMAHTSTRTACLCPRPATS